jgi:hypothetical protein
MMECVVGVRVRAKISQLINTLVITQIPFSTNTTTFDW